MTGRRERPRSGRLPGIDHLRGFTVALVVLHHSVLAYCRFSRFDRRHYLLSSAPIVDARRWLGFDILVLLNDSFFMPLLFLLSGLFVWRSLSRKGAPSYLHDRLLRLALPFALGVLIWVPLAYYPSARLAGSTIGFPAFWAHMVLVGPWPSGPFWFVAVLLVFDVAAVRLAGFIRPWLPVTPARAMWSPALCYGVLLAFSAAAYLPLLLLIGPSRWIGIGPFAIQASRIGLYTLYFAAGVAAGGIALPDGALSSDGTLARHWARWGALTVLSGALLVAVQMIRLRAGTTLPADGSLALYGGAFLAFCAAATFGLLAIFSRFASEGGAWAGLAASAYGIYLLHYPAVTWLQYALVGTALGAIGKAALVFAAALLSSWIATSLLRRAPGVARVV